MLNTDVCVCLQGVCVSFNHDYITIMSITLLVAYGLSVLNYKYKLTRVFFQVLVCDRYVQVCVCIKVCVCVCVSIETYEVISLQ